MHGKGAGAVNRVELECQVLCASLRLSWARNDKVGAFTSIRELSHLFPDLLPPPEEKAGSNKANYYETLSVRPQAGLNALVVGYLRSVRKFLREHNPKDYKQFYNTILNAGFVLRKPRLRLSHDLVVTRRWLYESQLEEEEYLPETESEPEAEINETPAAEPVAELPAAATEEPDHEQEAAAAETAREQSEPVQNASPFTASDSEEAAGPDPAVPEDAGAEEDDPLLLIERSWNLISGGKSAAAAPADTAGTSSSAEPASALPHDPPAALPQEPPVSEPPLAVSAAALGTAGDLGLPEAELPQEPPADQHAQPSQDASPALAASTEPSSSPEPVKQVTQGGVQKPSLVKLMEHAHLITGVEAKALCAQMELAPNIPVEQLVLNAGYATRQELNSLRLAEDLLSSGKISMYQFQVAMYDERTSGLRMAESLQVRGWLETSVKNPVEEFKREDS